MVKEIILTVHRVTVDEQVVYEGEEWGKAHRIFMRHAMNVTNQRVSHEIYRKYVPRYGGDNNDKSSCMAVQQPRTQGLLRRGQFSDRLA